MRILVILGVLVVSVRVAAASCGAFAHTAFSPRSGARLPPHPTIYLFDADRETDIQDTLMVLNGAVEVMRFRATRISTTHDYAVHRIELDLVSTHDSPITVMWQGKQLATYAIVADGEPDHARVVDIAHERFGGFPFSDVFRIAIDGNAIAFRIDWDDDRTTVLPDEHLMWSGEPAKDRSVIELGYPSCLLGTVEPGRLDTASARNPA